MKISHLLYFVILIIIASCSNEFAWKEANSEGSIKAYQKFVAENPKSDFISIAEAKIDSLDEELWLSYWSENSIEAYEEYLSTMPNGIFVEDAKASINELQEFNTEKEEWNTALALNTLEGYNDYWDKYPNSYYLVEPQIFLLNNPKFADEYKNIFDFFYDLSLNDFNQISSYFSSSAAEFYVSGDTHDKAILTPPYSEEQLTSFGYWNISDEIIYRTFLNGTFDLEAMGYGGYENKCEISFPDGFVNISIDYWDNGSLGTFDLKWKKENNEWAIVESSIYLPDFM